MDLRVGFVRREGFGELKGSLARSAHPLVLSDLIASNKNHLTPRIEMLHPDYPLWNFVGLLAVLLPLPWHWRARNVATLCLIFWLALADLVLFINTLIWADNVLDVSPVWCDMSSSAFLSESHPVHRI